MPLDATRINLDYKALTTEVDSVGFGLGGDRTLPPTEIL
jgi:hypothetical protein